MMDARRVVIMAVFMLVLIIAAPVLKNIILGGVPETRLSIAPPLASALSQSLISPQSKGVLPAVGKNFTIKSTHYFDNQQWAVVFVTSIPDNNNAALVLEKLSGNYQVVLGPGTSFSVADTQTMPADVINYLTTRGMLSSATYSQ